MRKNWIAVAAADHVARGRRGGFMQVHHGRAAGLKRIKPGDRIAYYSPTETFGGKDKLQAFTAIGVVAAGEPYPHDMAGGFRPFRRDVRWRRGRVAPIAPLLDALDFTTGRRNWGYKLRFGLFEVSERDFERIAAAMRARLPS
jgi:hypothetical protein